MQKFISHSYVETEEIASNFIKNIKVNTCIAFLGNLGVGKTAFVRGLAKGLHTSSEVCSPTYALVHEYNGDIPLIHFDMYRINNIDDLESTGFFDYLNNNYILAIEWSENILEYLPENTIFITINILNENTREIIIDD